MSKLSQINLKTCIQSSFQIIDCDCDEYDELHARIMNYPTINHQKLYQEMKGSWKNYLGVIGSSYPGLNAIFAGAKEVVLFDKNELNICYTYLLIAAILKLNYEDFCHFIFYGEEQAYLSSFYFKQIKEELPKDIKVYWQAIYEKYKEADAFCHNLFERDYYKPLKGSYYEALITKTNLFMSKEKYEILKQRLKQVKITCLNCRFEEVLQFVQPNTFHKIYCSCLNNYYIEELEQYFHILKEYFHLLKKGGMIEGAYLYDTQIEDAETMFFIDQRASELQMYKKLIPDSLEPTYFHDVAYFYKKEK